MTPHEFRAARQTLGLDAADMARMLGVSEQHIRRMEITSGAAAGREPTETVTRLMRAYLEGYRPADWPKP